jgi:hypothetical protein
VPPGIADQLADPSLPLWITEGSKKADCGVLQGLCVIALTGVWNWRGKNEFGSTTALADWHDIPLNGRRVIIAYDGDVSRNAAVQKAMAELARYLSETKGAQVQYLHLPDTEQKTGLDDYLMGGNTVEDRQLLDAPPGCELQGLTHHLVRLIWRASAVQFDLQQHLHGHLFAGHGKTLRRVIVCHQSTGQTLTAAVPSYMPFGIHPSGWVRVL